jgi:hypothetical protein
MHVDLSNKGLALPDYRKSLDSENALKDYNLAVDQMELRVWRIHRTFNDDGCLTFQYSIKSEKSLSWKSCKQNSRFRGKIYRYSEDQAFFLYVLPVYNPLAIPTLGEINPLDHNNYKHAQRENEVFKSRPGHNITRIMNYGEPLRWSPMHCLTLQSLSCNSTLFMETCIYPIHLSQSFITVEGVNVGNYPSSSYGLIRAAFNPEFCLVRPDFVQGFDLERFQYSFILKNCSEIRDASLIYFEFELVP